MALLREKCINCTRIFDSQSNGKCQPHRLIENFKADTRRKRENKAEVSKRSYSSHCQADPVGEGSLLCTHKDENCRDKLSQLEGVT